MEVSGQTEDKSIREALAGARTGMLRATLLFGSIAVALALVVAPAADRGARYVASGGSTLDQMTTGSIVGATTRRYTVRRSVLQQSDAAPCIVYSGRGGGGTC